MSAKRKVTVTEENGLKTENVTFEYKVVLSLDQHLEVVKEMALTGKTENEVVSNMLAGKKTEENKTVK